MLGWPAIRLPERVSDASLTPLLGVWALASKTIFVTTGLFRRAGVMLNLGDRGLLIRLVESAQCDRLFPR
jgi:hypothetical protein